MSDNIRIKVEKLNFFYGLKHALIDVNMDIYKNTVTSIIGPSGCGKSTFIRLINRMSDLVSHTTMQGKILLDGKNIFDQDVDVVELRRKVGMVFQKPNPFPKSIFENMCYGLQIKGITDKKVLYEKAENALRKAALWDEVKNRLNESALRLSGGQQQRLCIARCLIVEPEVMLFDEPCASLDPISTRKIEELIIELKKDYTIVVVTHNMQQAARISTKTAFFLLGELIESGNTEDIFTNPKDKRTEDYVSGRFG